MLVFPNSKINIGLNIINKRNDGFHNIETLFYPINLTDFLEFVVSKDKTEFIGSGIIMDGPNDNNLVLKAFKLLRRDYSLPELKIHLHKIIPIGAGLGGGSADAACMIKSLNNFFNLKMSISVMENYAQTLGSDCAFFIQNRPVFAEGTGNIFSEIHLDLKGYNILVVKPDIHISTKEAFSKISPKKPNQSIKEIIKLPINEWKNKLKNDFEDGIFKLYHEIEDIKNTLYDLGAIYAQMSGSGSAIYGIFDKNPILPKAFEKYFSYIETPM